jgi:hypothetical protein
MAKTGGGALELTQSTRRDVVDWLRVEGTRWSGRLGQEAFLDRIIDLDSLPSTDSRFDTARGDLRQHTLNNDDWDADWVFSYEPLALVAGPPDRFVRFLDELVHPVVPPDTDEARALVAELNDLIRPDGVALTEVGKIGNRPVWKVRPIDESPATAQARSPGGGPASAATAGRLWITGMFRLFISHVAAHKVAVSSLKSELAVYGVSSFVAHEDIEPSLEWQTEIELALETTDALLAVLTPDFHQSRWTDQEVGVVLGRGRLVVPLRVPEDPYGLMGKFQGLRGDLVAPSPLALRIVDVLLSRNETSMAMRSGLVRGLELANSFARAAEVAAKIVAVTSFTVDQLSRIERAIDENSQVTDSFKARGLLKRFLAASSPASASK